MKKLAVIAMLLTLCFGLAACNAEDGKVSDSQNSDLGSEISDDISQAEDNISGGISDAGDAASDAGEDISDALDGDDDDRDSSQSQSASTRPTEIDFSLLERLDQQKRGWGMGHELDSANRPTSCTTFQEKYNEYDAYFIKDDQTKIFLTFDEGYEAGFTGQILDVLKKEKVKAIFFVTYDYVKSNPELIRRMIDEGHVVGNHSYNHPSMPDCTFNEAADEINKLHDYVKEVFDYDMTLFRPPMGEFSEATLSLTQQLGYKSVFWSYAYVDWNVDDQPDVKTSLSKACNAAHGGAIYLLHACSETNTVMLGSFIGEMKAAGYTFSVDI